MRLQAEEDLLTLAAWRQAQAQRNALAGAGGEHVGLVGPGGTTLPLPLPPPPAHHHHVHPLGPPGPLRHHSGYRHHPPPPRGGGFQTVVPHPLAIPGSHRLGGAAAGAGASDGGDSLDSMSDTSPMLAPHHGPHAQHSVRESVCPLPLPPPAPQTTGGQCWLGLGLGAWGESCTLLEWRWG